MIDSSLCRLILVWTAMELPGREVTMVDGLHRILIPGMVVRVGRQTTMVRNIHSAVLGAVQTRKRCVGDRPALEVWQPKDLVDGRHRIRMAGRLRWHRMNGMPVHTVREDYLAGGIGRQSSWHPLGAVMFGVADKCQRRAGVACDEWSTGAGASQGEGVDDGGGLHCADVLECELVLLNALERRC